MTGGSPSQVEKSISSMFNGAADEYSLSLCIAMVRAVA